MKRAVLTAVLILGVAVPAFADITLKQTTTGKGMGMGGRRVAPPTSRAERCARTS